MAITTARAYFELAASTRRGGLPIVGFLARGTCPRPADHGAAVQQVIGGAVDTNESIGLFAATGLKESRLDFFCDEFLEQVVALDQKNLGFEALRGSGARRTSRAKRSISSR